MRAPDEVRLREVRAQDLPIFFEHQSDAEAARMADFASRTQEPFMAHWAEILADAGIDKRTITSGGRTAGNIVSWEQDGEREVGYWLGREYWGRGIASQALSLFLGIEKTRPLHARATRHNIASYRVLEKCGFERCGENAEEFLLKLDRK